MARGRLRPPMAEELSTPAWPPPSWLGPPRVSTASMVSMLPSMPMARGVLMLSPQLMLMPMDMASDMAMDMDMDMDGHGYGHYYGKREADASYGVALGLHQSNIHGLR